ncbi:MAG: ATP phosphoribosyltransferase regulatory subunit [Gammaproteobacteria bacterium 28-57-27]|nr:MAG: ATP phosphoribosyltransferase regulatory subunit [Gammaproteobacteria bacterium 28-57-27]
MNQENRWLLPAGIDELLPAAAWATEGLRRRVLDLFRSWGYGLVVPPMVEYVESLLIHPGDDLDLSTLKVIDQMTGRLMGIRADMTPQMARIDAHSLGRAEPTRLCYLGTVLHAMPGGFAGSRAPMQVGAELFGHAGIESDREILGLLLETLAVVGVNDVWLDLGHVGIFRALMTQAQFAPDEEAEFFDLLQRKAMPEIEAFLAARELSASLGAMLHVLAELHGEGAETLARARTVLADAGEDVSLALDNLSELARVVLSSGAGIHLHVDLAELRGYHYHTGMVFAAYVPGHRQAIARGGRYDGIGEAFGRARAATGFSADVRALIDLMRVDAEVSTQAIYLAPVLDSEEPGYAELVALVRDLRAQGCQVIQALPGDNEQDESLGDCAQAMGCTHRIEPDMTHSNEFWKICEI